MTYRDCVKHMRKRAKLQSYAINAIPAMSALDSARLGQLNEQRERNANRVLQQQLGIQDPTTAQRRLKWRIFGKLLKSGLIGAGLGAGAGVISEATNGGSPMNNLERLVPYALLGSGAGLFGGLLTKRVGSIAGDLSHTNPELVRRVYSPDGGNVSLMDIMRAKAHLNKMVQQRMSEYQADAPTQVIV